MSGYLHNISAYMTMQVQEAWEALPWTTASSLVLTAGEAIPRRTLAEEPSDPLASPTKTSDEGQYNPFGYGIACGESLCEHCCLVESETCGTHFECNSDFTVQFFIAIGIVALVLFVAMLYLLMIGFAGGRKNVNRISQVILQKHYTKMKREQIVAISIGKIVQKNAPIKYAEIVEGYSDIDIEDTTDGEESVKKDGNVVERTPPKVLSAEGESVNGSKLLHETKDKLNVSHGSDLHNYDTKKELYDSNKDSKYNSKDKTDSNKDKETGSGKSSKNKNSGVNVKKKKKIQPYYGPVMP